MNITNGHIARVSRARVDMTEDEKTEIAEQQVAAENNDTNSSQQNADTNLVQEQPKKDIDHNWQEANKIMKLQQQRIQDLEARLTQPPPQVERQEEKDEFAEWDPADYLTVEKAEKLIEKRAEKKAEAMVKKHIQEYSQQQQVAISEQHTRSKYEDYDYVVENFAIPLIKSDPALAHKIQTSKNPAETAYKLGKLSDQYEESMTKQQTNPKAEKVIKNSQRPVSGNSVGNPLKTQADQFAKMSQSQIWEMSQKYAKGA